MKHIMINRYLRLVTTKDAIVLKTIKRKPNEAFLGAMRIIHGSKGEVTKVPYIILHDFEQNLEEIVENLVKDYPKEFPNPNDAYIVPIMYGGHYLDDRIRWITV